MLLSFFVIVSWSGRFLQGGIGIVFPIFSHTKVESDFFDFLLDKLSESLYNRGVEIN